MSAVCAVSASALTLRVEFDVFGEIEIMRADSDGRFRDARRQMERGGGQHGKFAFQQRFQRRAVGYVDDFGVDTLMRRHIRQLVCRAIRNRDAIIAGDGQHPGDGRADIARADNDNVFHVLVPRSKFACFRAQDAPQRQNDSFHWRFAASLCADSGLILRS